MRSSRRWGPLAVVLVVGGGAWLLADVTEQPSFVNELSNADGSAREATIAQLASEPSRLDDLLQVLDSDASALVKAGLAEAIGRMSLSTSQLTGVVSLASSNDVVTRAAAVRILARHASGALGTLSSRAQDPEELASIRVVAVRGLGQAGGTATGDLRQVAGDENAPRAVRDAAVRALAVVSSDGLSDVYDLARESKASRAERENAIDALGEAKALSELTALASNSQAWVRSRALSAMVRTGDKNQGSTYAAALTDADATVRWTALQGLGLLGGAAQNRSAVLLLLGDTDPRVQGLAAKIAGRVSSDISSQVVPTLKTLLGSTTFSVRREAALALLQLHDKSGLTTMSADAANANPSIAATATQAKNQISNATW